MRRSWDSLLIPMHRGLVFSSYLGKSSSVCVGGPPRFVSRPPFFIRGFTLLEVIAVMIIASILAAIVVSQFMGSSGFEGQTTADKLLASARYAESLAQNQGIPTTLTVQSGSFSITQNGAAVTDPTLQGSSFTVPIPAGVSITPQTSVMFCRPGVPLVASTTATAPCDADTPVNAFNFYVRGSGPSVVVSVSATGYVYE